MDTQRAAELQVLLEGVPLPAHKRELVEYARRQDPDAARELEALPDREYRSLDEVGEALAPVQPSWAQLHDAPPQNPAQKALEKQTKTQNEQLKRQREELG